MRAAFFSRVGLQLVLGTIYLLTKKTEDKPNWAPQTAKPGRSPVGQMPSRPGLHLVI